MLDSQTDNFHSDLAGGSSVEGGHAGFNRVFASVLVGCLVLVSGFNFACDPLLLFHSPWFKEIYSSNERFRIPGFVRSLEYDLALVGASSAMAIRPADIKQFLERRPVMLVIGGATIAEESLAAETVLKQGKVRRLLWTLDPLVFSYPKWRRDVQMPLHLYRAEPADIAQYLLGRTTTNMSLTVISYVLGGPLPNDFVSDLDELYQLPKQSDYSPDSVRKAFYSTSAIAELHRRERALHTPFDEAHVSVAFDEYILALARRYPDVHFDVVLSPATTAFYQFMQRNFPSRFAQHMFVRKLAYERLTTETNVRVYDLQTDQSITADYRQFTDMLHFSPDVGRRILAAVRDGRAVDSTGEPASRKAIERSMAQIALP